MQPDRRRIAGHRLFDGNVSSTENESSRFDGDRIAGYFRDKYGISFQRR